MMFFSEISLTGAVAVVVTEETSNGGEMVVAGIAIAVVVIQVVSMAFRGDDHDYTDCGYPKGR